MLIGGEREIKIGRINIRANEQIRVPKVRLISEDGKQLGVVATEEALRLARESGLDLVEVAPKENPPVCRIMDYGKYKYQLEQKAKKARKHQASTVVKEIKMRPKIDRHDFEIKEKHVRRFLEKGARVKVTIMFRGREMAHVEIGKDLLNTLAEEVKDLGVVEFPPKLDGRNMIMTLTPLHHGKAHHEVSEGSQEKKGIQK